MLDERSIIRQKKKTFAVNTVAVARRSHLFWYTHVTLHTEGQQRSPFCPSHMLDVTWAQPYWPVTGIVMRLRPVAKNGHTIVSPFEKH